MPCLINLYDAIEKRYETNFVLDRGARSEGGLRGINAPLDYEIKNKTLHTVVHIFKNKLTTLFLSNPPLPPRLRNVFCVCI